MQTTEAVLSASPSDSARPPRWDVSTLYPSLESVEFESAFQAAIAGIADLKTRFDAAGIERLTEPPADKAAIQKTFESLFAALESLLTELQTIRGFLSAFVSTDSRNAAAQAKTSELRREGVALSLLQTRLSAWIGSIDVEALIAGSDYARTFAYVLRRHQISAAHLLPQGEEELVAGLSLSGGSAWSRLHGDLTSQLTVPLAGRDPLPMSVIRTLATNADRETRRLAYEAELAAWERVSLPLCAAMNSLKYESNLMAQRRGWGDVLSLSLFYNRIDHDTLDAMLSAARAAFPDFRRYLRAKARYLGIGDQLAWYDLFAPVGASTRTWAWPEAETFIAEQFGAYSPRLRDFAVRAFQEKWIDAEPRPGKRDGAFCMGVRAGESRILQNYQPSFGAVGTLAHELGHGYHNLCLGERPYHLRSTPSTLAETASIFCETIVVGAALKEGPPEDQLAILEDSLQGSCQVVVDITSRFLFESRVIEKRRQRDLSSAEMCDIMRDAQRETYGDGLQDDLLHPYMWAVKGHYYGSSFYNYPYMFGLLFGLGLYTLYEADPDLFRGRYDNLLSRTGMANCHELAADFGFDIRDPAFWNASFKQIRRQVDRFEQLTS